MWREYLRREALRSITWKLIASIPVGRRKIKWLDNVMKDTKAMKAVNWKKLCTGYK
jgi:hypothetical protein